MLYPLTFRPIPKKRIWGGQKLHDIYQKPFPKDRPIGESWEISDRPGDISQIANGPHRGKDLHWLVENYPAEVLGSAAPPKGRFPLLVKILDARETLSLQVHPPAELAGSLGGEPKTEMWYITQAEPEARLYVGLKRGTDRLQFEQLLKQGRVEQCFHRVSVAPGDTMFLPSGRVHALGAGLLLIEIQQNSDTTYRVFDWNRVGMDGKARELHVAESLRCIDFGDIEPSLVSAKATESGSVAVRKLVDDPLFKVEELVFSSGEPLAVAEGEMRIFGAVAGRVKVTGGNEQVEIRSGQFCLLPASVRAELRPEPNSKILQVYVGN